MDLMKFGEQEFLRQKGKAFSFEIETFIEKSIGFLENDYPKYNELKLISEFIDIHLDDGVMSDLTTLERLGYYGITEVQMELDNAIKHALTGSYKSTFSDLRRGLEMMITQVYFSLESIPKTEAHFWYKSIKDTPYMAKMLKTLIKKSNRFLLFENELKGISEMQELYWRLSDYSHNKGVKNGYRDLNSTSIFLGRTHLNEINLDTLAKCMDLYIDTALQILLALLLYNPVLIRGVPIDEKFGLNGPISGFYNDYQSDKVKAILPSKYTKFFLDITENDEDISNLIKSIENMPDITEEEFNKQVIHNAL